MNTEDLLRKNIIADMSEGVMTVDLNGTISHVNRAAEVILGIKAEMLVGKSFARCFLEHAENDALINAFSMRSMMRAVHTRISCPIIPTEQHAIFISRRRTFTIMGRESA